MIQVTKAFLPPKEDYISILDAVWESGWITNRGMLVQELENKLADYLGVSNIIIMNNGTVPIQIAIQLLGKDAEIITTPFSYVATTSAISWQNCIPVFVDIHPEYLTIDETKIEDKITGRTKAILATHVFGNPCNIEEIAKIANTHNLMVIYDAAHAFGVKYKGQSIFNYGDISTCSFHATKLFHTGEGGALITSSQSLYHQCYYRHNFGHNGFTDFFGVGINGKISELQAAMGLAILPYIHEILSKRKTLVENYERNLMHLPQLQFMKLRDLTAWNYSYFPVIFPDEETLLNTMNALNKLNVFPRRYFYPSLNKLNYVQYQSMPISEGISKCILSLPLAHDLSYEDVNQVCKIIRKVFE